GRDRLLAHACLELGHPGCDPSRITGAAEIGLVIGLDHISQILRRLKKLISDLSRTLARLELRVPVGQPGWVGVPPEDVAIQALDDGGVPAASERSGVRCRRQNGTL